MKSKQTSADYYDRLYARADWTLEASPQLPLYNFIAERIEPTAAVLDIACGSGLLAERLSHKGVLRVVGVDFSSVAIERATKRCPWATFLCGSLPGGLSSVLRQYTPSVAVLVEALEHLVEDRATLEALPQGIRVLLTVPSFDDEGHVRTFPTKASVLARYADLVRFDHVEQLGMWWAAEGIRHSASLAQLRDQKT